MATMRSPTCSPAAIPAPSACTEEARACMHVHVHVHVHVHAYRTPLTPPTPPTTFAFAFAFALTALHRPRLLLHFTARSYTPRLSPLAWREETRTPAPKGGVLKVIPATLERFTTRTCGAEGGVQAGCRRGAGGVQAVCRQCAGSVRGGAHLEVEGGLTIMADVLLAVHLLLGTLTTTCLAVEDRHAQDHRPTVRSVGEGAQRDLGGVQARARAKDRG
jgi:hypothetical protein